MRYDETLKDPHFKTKEGDTVLYPFSPPLFKSKVDSSFTLDLIKEGRKQQNNKDAPDFSPSLAGNLKYGKSFLYPREYTDKVEKYLNQYVMRFINGIANHYDTDYFNKRFFKIYDKDQYTTGTIKLESLWINFQHKHDYNPPHVHSGALSFVIFCKVPSKIFEVQADSNFQNAGNIVFDYGQDITPLMGTSATYAPEVDDLFIFPAQLKHFVPSFWVDEERISVSGNYSLTTI